MCEVVVETNVYVGCLTARRRNDPKTSWSF